MPKVTVRIDPSTCILAASCVAIEPKLFQIDQEPYAVLADPNGVVQGTEYTFESNEAELEVIQQAVDSCPTGAITVQMAG